MNGRKVLLGMSGGVDSSAAAAVLLDKGYEVCGCTLKMCEGASSEDARRVCESLGIKHIEVNMTERFDRHVIKPFAESYMNGETPNPCIECNRHIKFGRMLAIAEDMGFDRIATGHYADIAFDGDSGRWLLKKSSAEIKKDQSYVLYSLTQKQLSRTLFPLGGMTKAEARAVAKKCGLPNADKKDSQDICFIPDGNHGGFIERYTGIKPAAGDFINTAGKKIGVHSGIIHYTAGQRKGLGVTFGKPVFVIEKDAENNTVTLSEGEGLYKKTLYLRDVNLISVSRIDEPMKVTAKARYGAAEQAAIIYPGKSGIMRIVFDEPVRAPARGQVCVFYDSDTVVGGGVINGAE